MANTFIKIRDKIIPMIIRNYSNSYNVKVFFKGNVLNISKPARMSAKEINRIIQKNENEIYNQYISIMNNDNNGIKQWNTGDKVLYEGEEYVINRKLCVGNSIGVYVDTEKKSFNISIPNTLEEDFVKPNVDKCVKSLFRNNTTVMLQERLPYWSRVTNIDYESFAVKDATTRFGSCVPCKMALHFNSRLIMLSKDKVDAVIVHELCHMVYANHGKEFFELVKQYIPNYDEIDVWLKENSNLINI